MPIIPSKITAAQRAYDKISQLAEREVVQTDLVTTATFDTFWAGGAAGAQAICDIAGTDARAMFVKQGLKLAVNKAAKLFDDIANQPPEVQAAIGAIVAATQQMMAISPEFAPPHTVAANEDGTITITEITHQ